MTWIGTEDVIEFTGVKPQTFRFEKGDDASLETLLEKWILQAEGLIISYCNYDFNDLEEIPPAVVNVCLRLTANMVALAQARKDTPVVQVKDWTVQTISSNIFSNDLKRDLAPFVREAKSHKSDRIDFFVITGDDDSW